MISKVMTASAAALCTLAFVSFASPSAQAGEFCNTDSSGIRGCGYATLEQCKAAIAGKMGTCDRDPFYKNPKERKRRSALRSRRFSIELGARRG